MNILSTRAASRTFIAQMIFVALSQVLSGGGAQGGTSAQQVPAELRGYIERFTGTEALDCGRYFLTRPRASPSASELQRAVDCATDSATGRKPFLTFKQDQGIDSLIFQGLIGTIEGAVFRFSYDSAPCGGPRCPGRFSVERCDKPTMMTNRRSDSEFGCRR
jgi:hypothetical protein